jgi:predicted enzyme related to lactoylglutathione lyase
MSEENDCGANEDKTPGKVSWNELMTSDTGAASEFYGGLFGWKSESMDMGGGKTYNMFKNGDDTAAGMMQIVPEMGPIPPHWMSYVTVESVDDAVAKVTELGGTVMMPPTTIPMGRLAIIQDPQKASLGLWEYAKD